MPRFVAVYTMKPEGVAAFRARPESEQEAIDKVGLKAWEEWGKRNAATIVANEFYVPSVPGALGVARYMLKEHSVALPPLREFASRAPNLSQATSGWPPISRNWAGSMRLVRKRPRSCA